MFQDTHDDSVDTIRFSNCSRPLIVVLVQLQKDTSFYPLMRFCCVRFVVAFLRLPWACHASRFPCTCQDIAKWWQAKIFGKMTLSTRIFRSQI